MDPEFYRAALEGNVDTFKEKGRDVEFLLTPNKNTILHIHFTAYSDKISEAFLEEILRMCPALVMKANAKGETPLHIAARYGHSQIVSMLIESAKAFRVGIENEVGAEKKLIRAINDNKDTALHEATCYGHTQVVKTLTKEDPYHSYFANSAGKTPLYLAAERAYLHVVQIILENCKSPNHDGPNGRTALHDAVISNNEEMVSKLLKSSTSAKQADENGWVPLHLAAIYDSTVSIELLLKDDRNTAYIRDKKGRTALHLAAWHGNVDTMEMIISCCPDCSELVDENGANALHYVLVRNKPGALEMIMNNPSLSNLCFEKDENGNTPFRIATPALEFLLREKGFPRVDKMAFNSANVASATSGEGYRSEMVKIMNEMGRGVGDSTEDGKEKMSEEDGNVMEKFRETNFIVATLIATVTFAAGFTMPGGTIQEGQHRGSALLKHNPAFQAFIITDCLALVLSASAVFFHIVIHICMMASSSRRLEMLNGLVGIPTSLTMLAMWFMMIAYVTGAYAMLAASKAIAIVTLLIGLSFFSTIFILVFKAFKYALEIWMS